ncbi:hypothetical protein DFH09DRAFT_1305267 [Mycena vulgaris]|nr:hypothetical protein DFH09DRAFT_1305267 [Mycena vulgaris]
MSEIQMSLAPPPSSPTSRPPSRSRRRPSLARTCPQSTRFLFPLRSERISETEFICPLSTVVYMSECTILRVHAADSYDAPGEDARPERVLYISTTPSSVSPAPSPALYPWTSAHPPSPCSSLPASASARAHPAAAPSHAVRILLLRRRHRLRNIDAGEAWRHPSHTASAAAPRHVVHVGEA